MRLSTKLAAALTLLLCLAASGCSRPDDAASNVHTALSSAPSPQNAGAQQTAENTQPKNENTRPENTQPKAESPLPPPKGFVNDYANALDGESEKRLESLLTELRDKSDIEFAVVTVETTGGRPIAEYSLAVAKGWGVGPKDTSKGGGLLLMLAMKERQWRLQVGRSLEKDLPDAQTKRLGDEAMKSCREGKCAEGVTRYVGALVERLEEVREFKLSKRSAVK
ncbi:MAG TPA: TPM domain-containing protein [Pyrinomonadaceae bacterium]|jgi:uncharacterized protein|nr:TPM domain-containing protein [Pyrinomonadaceae bacterium]